MSIAEKLTTIAENEQKVFNSGREQGLETGYNSGHTEGYEFGYIEGNADGQDAMLIKVWNAIQENGNRTNYQYAFNHQVWNEETFKPNYDLNFVGETRNVFLSCNFVGSLKTALDKAGVKINTSNCIALYNCFYNMPMLTELPKLDLTKATENLANLFYNCPELVRIDGIVCSENTNFYSNTFGTSLGSLEECIFSGVIGNNLKLSNCTKLNHESLMSVINCLKDLNEIIFSNDDSNSWIEGTFSEANVHGYKITINAEITEGEKYTVRVKDNGYDEAVEDETREFDFLIDLENMVTMTYDNGYLVATFTAQETISGELDFDAWILTDYSRADLGSIEILKLPATTKTLTLGTTLQAKLTDEEKAIATQKGWTIA